ncbi:putative F-box protein-like [Capsicum annuum]|nr:putative F-box protein-like [Capsicum annuum]
MKKWPVSLNIVVAPPEITTLPGRLSKNRKKEVGEIKKSGKLPRTRLAMTCSVCHVRGHNKRGCPHRASSTEAEPTAPSVTTATRLGRKKVGTTKRGMGSSRKNTSPFKRQRAVGMGVFQAENGFKVLNKSQQENYNNLKRIEESRQWEVVYTIQVNIALLHNPRCHENYSDVDVF